MKIGIVGYPTFGGSGVIATELGKALASKGHQVHFVSYKQPARLNIPGENIFFHEVNIVKYPLFEYPPYELALISKLVDLINYEKLEILHVHYAIPHAFAAYMAKTMLAKKGYNIPIVTTLHGTDITLVGNDPTFETAVTYSINHSDAVTAVSQHLRQATYQYFDVSKEIQHIPNFVDIKNFPTHPGPEFRSSLAEFNEPIITHISNFRKVKRVEDVVKIFAEVRKTVPAKLIMVGDGPEKTKAEKVCRDQNFCDDVRFLGKMDDVAKILNISDLFLLPSETESFGLAALEAMTAGVPVISTNTGGLPEVNIHGKTGYTAPVGDVMAMAEGAKKLLMDENLLNQFKQNAYSHALKFDISEIMPKYEKVYADLLEFQLTSASNV
jgi:N-acetyl-alpha-D-glucosaminyl L-malate synthase BshA